jgi:UDP-N-acetylglucosamine 2-epimerase (non-hydrolysing)
MIDTLRRNQQKAQSSHILEQLCLSASKYAVLMLHRPSNVDEPKVFCRILDARDVIQKHLPIIFPVHPRTRKNLLEASLSEKITAMKGLVLIDPLSYLDFLKLVSSARVVLTDSGGIQEETTILKIPCLTLRENTERP